MATILRYAARVKRKARSGSLAVAIVGAGSFGTFLAPALAEAGYRISEIIVRRRRDSLRRARVLARKVGAAARSLESAVLDADVLWFAVPDRNIRTAAEQIATHAKASGIRFALHSSGALGSRDLEALAAAGVQIAAVHPLMTFVPGAKPALAGVPFAIEGDPAAVRVAQRVVRDLGGRSFLLSAQRKANYHAWATMTSPLLLAYLMTMEEAAREAGLTRREARWMSLPIVRQTLRNYENLGPAHSFSGPFVRGDVDTVAKHLQLLKDPKTRAVYVALARAALRGLPVRNKKEMRRLLEG